MSVQRILVLCALFAAGPCLAESLLIDVIDRDAPTSSMRPSSGDDMSRVEAEFGAPSERRSPVGDPPITRWEYPGFVVYFEHDKVIHTVVRH